MVVEDGQRLREAEILAPGAGRGRESTGRGLIVGEVVAMTYLG